MRRSIRWLALVTGLPLILLALTGSSRALQGIFDDTVYEADFHVVYHNPDTVPPQVCLNQTYDLYLVLYEVRVARNGVSYRVPARERADYYVTKGSSLGLLLPIRSWSVPSEQAHYIYKATSTGTDEMKLSVEVDEDKGADIDFKVEVIDCNVKVGMIYNGELSIPYGTYYFTGIMEDVTLEADEDGQLHGEGAMVFYENAVPSPCGLFFTTVTMPATITGEIGEDGQLGLEFSFEEGEGEASMSCRYSPTVTGDMPDRAFLVNSPVSLSSEGGVVTYPSPPPISGTVFVIVTVEDEEEATSDAGAQALAALSAWFAAWPGRGE